MSELKAYIAPTPDGTGLADYYLKSEADKVIEELEESHKKEVEQLLIEIVKLKTDYKEACDRLQTANLIKDEQLAATRHHKYKRCAAMARWCCDACDKWMMRKAKAIGLGKDGVIEYHKARSKLFHYMRWQQRWLMIAEQFKDKEA